MSYPLTTPARPRATHNGRNRYLLIHCIVTLTLLFHVDRAMTEEPASEFQ